MARPIQTLGGQRHSGLVLVHPCGLAEEFFVPLVTGNVGTLCHGVVRRDCAKDGLEDFLETRASTMSVTAAMCQRPKLP